jgi:hypothetical protein
MSHGEVTHIAQHVTRNGLNHVVESSNHQQSTHSRSGGKVHYEIKSAKAHQDPDETTEAQDTEAIFTEDELPKVTSIPVCLDMNHGDSNTIPSSQDYMTVLQNMIRAQEEKSKAIKQLLKIHSERIIPG